MLFHRKIFQHPKIGPLRKHHVLLKGPISCHYRRQQRDVRRKPESEIEVWSRRGVIMAVVASITYYDYARTQLLFKNSQENQNRLENGIMTLYGALSDQSKKMGELTEAIEKQENLFVPKLQT